MIECRRAEASIMKRKQKHDNTHLSIPCLRLTVTAFYGWTFFTATQCSLLKNLMQRTIITMSVILSQTAFLWEA